MTERPILMSAAMVCATLREIDPKSQTRRALKVQRQNGWGFETPPVFGRITSPHPNKNKFGAFIRRGIGTDFPETDIIICPYGQPGDRLWVRENGWERPERTPKMMREGADTWEPYYFDADGYTDLEHDQFKEWRFKRRPSIHMPRWASRILLEIVSVRVERLQDISEADATAEGTPHSLNHPAGRTAVENYQHLWECINGDGSWDANPWVWVIEFKRVKP